MLKRNWPYSSSLGRRPRCVSKFAKPRHGILVNWHQKHIAEHAYIARFGVFTLFSNAACMIFWDAANQSPIKKGCQVCHFNNLNSMIPKPLCKDHSEQFAIQKKHQPPAGKFDWDSFSPSPVDQKVGMMELELFNGGEWWWFLAHLDPSSNLDQRWCNFQFCGQMLTV